MLVKRKSQDSKNLSDCIYYAKDDSEYIIKDTPKLGLLKSLGIVKDACVRKVMTHKMGGPVLLKVESCEIAIGKDIAEKIVVRG